MPMQSGCLVKNGHLPVAETNAVAVHLKRRHGGAVKWRWFPAKSHGFCERGHPFAANGKAISETKGRESLAGTMALIASLPAHCRGEIPDAGHVRRFADPAAGNFSPFAAARIYQSRSRSTCGLLVHGASH